MTEIVIPPQAVPSPGPTPTVIYEMAQSPAIQFVELVQPPLPSGTVRTIFQFITANQRISVHLANPDPREPISFIGIVTQLAVDGFALKLEDGTTMYVRLQSIAYWKTLPP